MGKGRTLSREFNINTSKLELYTEQYLTDHNISFERHKKIILWENKYKYKLNTMKKESVKLQDIKAYVDFYLPDYDYY